MEMSTILVVTSMFVSLGILVGAVVKTLGDSDQ
jgi:hypothetical protein